MKKTILLLVLVVSVFAGITALTSCDNSTTKNKKTESNETKTGVVTDGETAYQCPMLCEGDKTYDTMGKCPECKMNLKKTDKAHATYQCPMKCEGEKTYDKPGNCPECGMKIKKNHVQHDNDNHKHNCNKN